MKVNLSTIGSGYGATAALNANFDAIETAIENTLSRDGTTPNEMEANLDMNDNSILNVDALDVASLTINGTPVQPSTGVTVASAFQSYTFTATAGQTSFSVSPYTPYVASVQVEVNGLSLPPAEISVSGTNVVIPACSAGDEVVIRRYTDAPSPFPVASDITFTASGTTTTRTTQSKLRDITNISDFTNSTQYDTARNALVGRNDLVVRPDKESIDLLLSAALDQTRSILFKSRVAPHANFNFFTSDFTVVGCAGSGKAAVLQDLRDVWTTKYSGFMTGGIVYVDATNGSDANAGTITAPWQTIDKALRTSASGLVHVMPGNYESTGFRYTDTQGDRPKMLVAPFGGVTIRASGDSISGATWTANGTYPNVYETTLVTSNHVIRVLRSDRTDSLSLPTPMPKCASLVDVNNQGYGWWYDSATKKLYVRDGALNINTAVKANLQAVYAPSGDNQLLVYSAKLYLENITLLQYPFVLKVAGQAVPEVWLKNCTVRYAESHSRTVQGGGSYSQGCTYYRSTADHANYTTASSTTAYGVEINDTTYFAGDVDTFGSGATQPNNPLGTGQNKNSSSNHDGYVVRVNGVHTGSYGPVIADTNGSYTWNLGVQTGYSYATGASRYGILVQGVSARSWLDGCFITSGSSGINADTSAQVSYFNSLGSRVVTNNGTFISYLPT